MANNKSKSKISYGELSVKYTEFLKKHKELPSSQGWTEFALEYNFSCSAAKKGCPKSAFLGLCQEGYIRGIPSGNYTRSKKNKEYAVKAVEILKNNDALKNSPLELWNKIPGSPYKYNHQMDVVCALWKKNLIKKD